MEDHVIDTRGRYKASFQAQSIAKLTDKNAQI